MSGTARRPTVALCFLNYGPYHAARLRACRRAMAGYDVRGVQMARVQREYGWAAGDDAELLTVESTVEVDEVPAGAWHDRVARTLDELQPAVCAVAGYSHPSMRAVMSWCRRRGAPAVLMSDSTAWDAPRTGWREWVKARLVSQCSAALVAGAPHADYLASLGAPRERIALGYDVVDNDHFATGAASARADGAAWRASLGLPSHYFLSSSRFVDKKNLPTLLRAYAGYRRRQEGHGRGTEPWELVLLGDGPLRPSLESQCEALGLAEVVRFVGFQQYDALPRYYGLAEALVHASTVEQWGLVVNEALASGLPVLVSSRCGCTSTLVQEGENGYVFEPTDEARLTELMTRLSQTSHAERAAMSRRGSEIVAQWGLDRFAQGLEEAVEAATSAGPARRTSLGLLVERALSLAGQ